MKDFENVIGYADVKQELARICDLLKNEQKYSALGVTPPGGLLLHGEPGVGKTTLAKCFIQISGRRTFVCRKLKPDGEFVNEIKATFDEAVMGAPSIVFLDDMDKFANDDRYHRNSEEFVAVQSCIDEVKGKNVFVLATANDLDNLPDSLLRAGRFDKVISVKNPTGQDAVEIIRHYLGKKNFIGEIDAEEIAKILNGRSCAELETVINEAGIYAGYDGKEQIEMNDIIKACMRVIYKAPESETVEDEFLEQTAYHEAGHAVVAEVLEEGSVSLVSVCEHGREIGGITVYYQPDRYFRAKKYMENRVLAVLAGKAATEVKYGETDVGANSDLHRAFDIVTRFIDNYCSYGFESWIRNSNESSDDLFARKNTQTYTEIERYYQTARKILIQNREFLDKLAGALVEKKTLIGKDIRALRATCKIVA